MKFFDLEFLETLDKLIEFLYKMAYMFGDKSKFKDFRDSEEGK